MAKDKVELLRDWYSLSEAAEIAGLKVDDLIHLAARNKLPICVNANNWNVTSVTEVPHTMFDKSDEFRTLVGSNAIDRDGFEQRVAEFLSKSESSDDDSDVRITHDREGRFGGLYGTGLIGIQPISWTCFHYASTFFCVTHIFPTLCWT